MRPKVRPFSVVSVIAPQGRSRDISGTHRYEVAPGTSSPPARSSSGSPVRITTAGPCGRSGRKRRAVVRRGGGAHDRAVLAQHVDRAPVGEAGDEQGGEALERLLAGPG